MSGYNCAHRGCSSRTGEGKSLFSFPKDEERAKLWMKACNREDLMPKIKHIFKDYKLCELHFEDKYILKGDTRKLLVQTALPTIFDHVPKRIIKEEVEKDVPTETPKKVIILSDVKAPKTENPPSTSEQSMFDTCGPSTSQSIGLEPLVIPPRVEDGRAISSILVSSTTSTQTTLPLNYPTPRKVKPRKQMKSLQTSNLKKKLHKKEKEWTLQDFNKLCDMFLSQPFTEIVKTHAALKNKKPKARRYSIEFKQFALTLYFLSPRAYNFLSKVMTLPTARSLQRITQQLYFKPGLKNVAMALEVKIRTMLEQDKHCILCVDEMSLKSNLFYNTNRDEIIGFQDIGHEEKDTSICKHVLVIMARGLYSDWKQPIAYFFVGSQLKAKNLRLIMEECIFKLSEMGLSVDGITSDMGLNFIHLASSLGVTPENPEFELGGQKLVYIFDPCYLIKVTRNILFKYSFCFKETRTSWSFIEDFFNQDKKQFYRCAPKLTDSHIHSLNFEKMRVSLATQVLSHTVASSMNTYVTLGALPKDALGTVEVIELFNNLFDTLNSFSTGNCNKHKNVYDGSDDRKSFLKNTLEFLSNLKIFSKDNQDITNRVKFQRCWAITINSVLKLWETLSKSGFMYLKTRRINTDCIKLFFGSVRKQTGNNGSPTPIQFKRAFRKLFCQHYFYSNHMNCKNDLDALLMNLKSSNISEIIQKEEEIQTPKALILSDYSYRKENAPTEHAFNYICEYIIRKALEIHSCDICQGFGKQFKTLDINDLLSHFKASETREYICGLPSPPEEFLNFVYQLEKMFIYKFEEISKGIGISHRLLNLMEKFDFNHPCHNFPKLYVKKLFIRMKIFYTLKYNNKNLQSSKKENKINRNLETLSYL